MKNIFLVGFVSLVTACTAQQSSVENVPPRIEKPELNTLSFGVEFGMMKPEVISVLLWPKEWTEKETEDRVYTISKNSRYFDQLIIEKMTLAPQIQGAFAQFTAQSCIAKFRKSAAEGAPALKDPAEYAESDDVDWMEARDVAPEAQAAYGACLANVAYRASKHQRDDEIIHGTPAELATLGTCPSVYGPVQDAAIDASKPKNLPVVSTAIDCAIGLQNKISVGTEGSQVKILPSPTGAGRIVEMSLGNFNGAGERVSQSVMKTSDIKKKTELQASLKTLTQAADIAAAKESLKRYAKFIRDVSIDADGRHLKFTVPDMKSELVESSTSAGVEFTYVKQYAFDLYRVDNLTATLSTKDETGTIVALTDVAKFKGDISVQENGIEVRKGSGQLMGPFTGAPRQ